MRIEMVVMERFEDRNPSNCSPENRKEVTYVIHHGRWQRCRHPFHGPSGFHNLDEPLENGAVLFAADDIHRICVTGPSGGCTDYIGHFRSREEFLDCWCRNFAARIIDQIVVE